MGGRAGQASRDPGCAEQGRPGAWRRGGVGRAVRQRRKEGERKGKEEKKRKWKKWEKGKEKEKEGREREKGEGGGGIRAAIAAPGRPRAASGTRARSRATRGPRANSVMDSDVGVGSFEDREIRRENGLSSTTKNFLNHFIA